MHNFGEGLAIGQAAAASKISLAVTLIIGFGLHNATEGFGICGPIAGEGTKPSWGFLGLLGLIGGAPTFLGTLLGQAWSSEAVSVDLLRRRGGLDPLRRAGALRGQPQVRTYEARDVARARRRSRRLRDRLRRHRFRHLNTARSGRTYVASAAKPASSSHVELLGHARRHVVVPVDLDRSVLGSLRDDDVAEHEDVRDLRNSREQFALTVSGEMVDGEHGDDEIERAGRERLLEP